MITSPTQAISLLALCSHCLSTLARLSPVKNDKYAVQKSIVWPPNYISETQIKDFFHNFSVKRTENLFEFFFRDSLVFEARVAHLLSTPTPWHGHEIFFSAKIENGGAIHEGG